MKLTASAASMRHVGFVVFFVAMPTTLARGFLGSPGHIHADGVGLSFQDAVGVALGCGGRDANTAEIREALLPAWHSHPKNEYGNVEWRSLRYLAHRYFMQKSSLMVRGFEPSRQVNDTHVGHADIVSERVPALVDLVLDGKRSSHGFTLDDAAVLVASLEELLFDAESHMLERVYHWSETDTSRKYGSEDVAQLLEAYMVHWMMGDDEAGIMKLLGNPTLLSESFHHWHYLAEFVRGEVEAFEFKRQIVPDRQSGSDMWRRHYSFRDVHEMVGKITSTFMSYWGEECRTLKTSLVGMDNRGSGRVRLADFYAYKSDGESRFRESEAYLRDLGALDETSSWHGKQVIIPNYIQAASNCFVNTAHYLVCCPNECGTILGELEQRFNSPTASPEALVEAVSNVTDYDGLPPRIEKSLISQLKQVADLHGGTVPLHGRLFAQWLHYVFPRECPFPHKSGAVSHLTPTEFGRGYLVSAAVVTKHTVTRTNASDAEAAYFNTDEELQRISQWSADEELAGMQIPTPGNLRYRLGLGGVIAGLALFSGLYQTGVVGCASGNGIDERPVMKAHIV